ncbi:MAG: protein kinase [Myxococcota bacterium]
MSGRLGPFQLLDVLGHGAMGVVYRAVHAGQQVPVAVKVDSNSADPRSNAAFLHEVQITAALDHPNVVMLLDHGEVDAEASRLSGGRLREGARWLAMELASGGTVGDDPPADWAEVRHLCKGVLDALAHAHARGVVHRDIKLQNLLLTGPEASVATAPASFLESRIVLSDFGISDQRDRLRDESPAGTPQFMAPELIEGRWRDQGPWTDMYAVGVMLWLVITGNFPFNAPTAEAVYRMHLDAELPPFVPDIPVPDGTEALVRSLLAKAPADRPEFAAEVTRALEAIGDALPGQRRSHALADDEATVATGATALRSRRDLSYAGRSRRTLANVPLLHEGRRKDSRMEGAGLALFGLRSVPFVGREAECDRLWNELVAVRTGKRARCVFIRGPAGIGKSRLAEWVSQRTHELGVATTLSTHHEPGEAAGHGLVEMLRRELHTSGLDAAQLDARLEARFGAVPFDLRALAATLEPSLYDRAPTTPAELRQLAIAVLAELASTRPIVVVLDDVQHDLAALELIDSLLILQELQPRPILVLATLRSEDLVDVPELEELLGELLEDPAASELLVEPLDPEGRGRLVRSLLELDGALAKRIEERTAGNPLFAKQLIGAWVEQGILRPSPRGFQLADGVVGDLPSDVEEVWRSRLADALHGHDAQAIEALHVAAAWGNEVVDERWRGACDVLEVRPGEGLFDELRKRHLIHLEDPRGARWRFVHGVLREVLVQQSRAADHWRRHNLGIAVWLRETGSDIPAVFRARHFLEAEVWDEAIEPLCEAINDQIDTGDLRSPGLVNSLESVLDTLGLHQGSQEWAELQILKAIRARARGDLEEAESLAVGTAVEARENGWGALEAKSLREAARILWSRGTYDRALVFARRGKRAFEVRGDAVRAADCECVEGTILCAKGRFDEAEAAYAHAIEVFDAQAADRVTTPLLGMVRLNQLRGDTDRTAAWLAETRARAEPMGLQLTLALCANAEGELARAAGDMDAAAAHYRVAVERYRALESSDFVFPLVNLGILDVTAGRDESAAQRMQPLLLHLRRNPNNLFFAYTHMVLMAAYAGIGDQAVSVGSFAVVRAYVKSTGLVDPDLAEMAELTGLRMRERAWPEHLDALKLAHQQFADAGRPTDAERILALL